MKKILIGRWIPALKALCVAAGLMVVAAGWAQLPEQSSLFNDGWSFHQGDLERLPEGPVKQTAGWESVDLPHDWSIQGPFAPTWASATGFLPGGVAWYKKDFEIEATEGQQYYLYFDGVYKNSSVWLNGHLLGQRPNGFVSFYYNLTPYLKTTGTNELVVKVEHKKFADSRWYTGSGIYRNVYLVEMPAVEIPIYGLKLSTAVAGDDLATVGLEATINSHASVPHTVYLRHRILNANGQEVGRADKELKVAPSEQVKTLLSVEIAQPILWSTKNPYLYTVETSLLDGDAPAETIRTKLGVRTIAFNKDRGFSLNGRSMKLKGVCLHDDVGSFGTAVPMAVWKERLQRLKGVGCNAIRMSHNPHAMGLYDLCDQMGFLVIDEAFDEWALGKHKWITGWNDGIPGTDGYHSDFDKWWSRDLADMIQRNYNHPSIIMWSIGNEIDYPNDPYSDPVLDQGHYPQIYGSGYMKEHPDATALGKLSAALAALTRSLDSTRPVTAGLAAVMVADKAGYTDQLDVAGYNYQEYRYEQDHRDYPQRIIYGSENGHGFAAWQAVRDHPFVMGQFLWTGIDYLGEASRWPSHGNEAGLLDLAGYMKPEYYFRQSIWTTAPMVYLGTSLSRGSRRMRLKNSRHGMASRNWNYRPGDTIDVYCYTNGRSAALYLNEVQIGTEDQNDSTHVICWRVPYQQGRLVVKVKTSDGQLIEDALQTFGVRHEIRVASYPLEQQPGEQQYYAVDIRITDAAGNTVLTDSSDLGVQVEGPATLVGLENGNVTDQQPYGTQHRKVYRGRLRAYIKASDTKEDVHVRVRDLTRQGQILNSKTVRMR